MKSRTFNEKSGMFSLHFIFSTEKMQGSFDMKMS